ncbi:uncharacterized protein [Haliotis cracherodii]|uniref:uncharacterized protein isoform X1 n=1 Tax=Haliotis cracherodii TaxID=6455 RepID=UPI0039EBC2DF
MVSAMSTFHSKKGALYPARCNIFPKLLNSRREFVIPDDFETINTGEPFLLMNDGEEDKILGFSTDANLDYLCQVDTIFEDGKFYVTPNLFHQLYTLHALIAGQLLPLVFFLLRDKQEVTYQRMFHLLIANCQTRGYQLLPDIIQMGFKVAVRNAVTSLFPRATWKGCFFHFAQSVRRKTQQCNTQKDYTDRPEITTFVRQCAIMPLIPVGNVEDYFLELMERIPDDQRCQRLADYMTSQWIEGDLQIHQWNLSTMMGHVQTTT